MNQLTPKPAGSYWSDDQWEAISLSGGNMLVAAAAGSGKTAVLVERIIRKITDQSNPVDIERLMVATFTKAAAAEMRQRIREALEDALEKDGGNEQIQRQLAMLGRARITTLHSFCMEVIQRYYTMIPLDPGFRIASEHETKLLKQEVMEELFEEKYSEEEAAPSAFFRLVDWFGGERSDEAMLRLTHRLYEFSRSHPWPAHWLRSMAMSFKSADLQALEDSVWIKSIKQDTLLTLDGMVHLLMQAKALSLSPGGPAPYAATLEEDLNLVLNLREEVKNGPWSRLYEAFQPAVFGKLKAVRKDQADPAVQSKVKSYREEAKKSLVDLRQHMFGRPASAFLEELHEAAPLMEELAELVIRFDERYQEEKAAKGWLDFSDLEHYCLRILMHSEAGPLNVLPSDAALEYQALYEEVLLDEYQDTNSVQEMIVSLISRAGNGNRFMVGDVKQSIYRFRLAEPGLFLSKYHTYGADFAGEGKRIDLAQNFRSRQEVVGAVNMLFRQIMNAAVAEIDYDHRAKLVYGSLFPDHERGLPQYEPELLLIDRSSEENAAEPSTGEEGEPENGSEIDVKAELEAVQLEARAIAARIRGLLGEGGTPLMVYDKSLKASRPAVYGDIVILLRSTSAWAPLMIQELAFEGIPASGELNQGYFQATEVEVMLSLLQTVDNPRQDIPLASVLRSPLVGLDEEQLAKIRLGKSGGSYYEALVAWHEAASLAGGHSGEQQLAEDKEDQEQSGFEPLLREKEYYGAEVVMQDIAQPGASDQKQLEQKTAQPHEEGMGLAISTEALTERANAVTGNRFSEAESEGMDFELYVKVDHFLRALKQWRDLAQAGELSALIWNMYESSLYLDWVGGLPGGTQRQANLRTLHARAVQYERTSNSAGLFGFLRFIEKLKENGEDFGAPSAGGQEQETVRIMTIHKSKGLEFPVVFVAGLSKGFNKQDLTAPFMMHKELGFGPRFVDGLTRVSYPTLPNLAIRGRSRLELIAEEMRILYVALTRPKDKLILVSAVKNLEKSAGDWSQSLFTEGELLPDYLLAKARSYMDWIGPALIRHPSAKLLRDLSGEMTGGHLLEYTMDSPNWQISILPAGEVALAAAAGKENLLLPGGREAEAVNRLLKGEPDTSAEQDANVNITQNASNVMAQEISRRLEWTYPYAAASRIAAKTSVTELKSLLSTDNEPAAADVEELAELRKEREAAQETVAASYQLHLRRPKFMERKSLSPAERGTAYHTLMQHLPLGGDAELSASAVVARTMSLLAEKRILATEVLAELDPAVVTAFLEGPIGAQLRQAQWIKRELPFTYLMPADQAYPHFAPLLEDAEGEGGEITAELGTGQSSRNCAGDLAGETVLVQGIIDCLYALGDKQILLDYKSDKVLEHKGGLEALKERYRLQLELYSRAVEDITGLPVAEKWLYFLDTGEAVQI